MSRHEAFASEAYQKLNREWIDRQRAWDKMYAQLVKQYRAEGLTFTEASAKAEREANAHFEEQD